MRSFILFFLIALLTTINALAAPAESAAEIEGRMLSPIADRVLPPTPVRQMTNAERFARGLPPAAPRRRGSPIRRQGGASPTPTVTYQRSIQVRGADGSALGYVSKRSIGHAVYQVTTNPGDALTLNFALPAGQTSGDQLNIRTLNSDIPGYLLIGPIGSDTRNFDMAAGSANSGFFGNVGQTAPGAPAALDGNSYNTASNSPTPAESAVWSVNLAENTITPRWINADGSTPALSFWVSNGQIYFGGDPAAWATVHHTAAVPLVTFQLIWTPAAP